LKQEEKEEKGKGKPRRRGSRFEDRLAAQGRGGGEGKKKGRGAFRTNDCPGFHRGKKDGRGERGGETARSSRLVVSAVRLR